MEEEDLKYIRCPNCGRYFAEEQEERFCSEECKVYYKNCIACGAYFVSSRNQNDVFCSTECGTNPEPLDPQSYQTPVVENQ